MAQVAPMHRTRARAKLKSTVHGNRAACRVKQVGGRQTCLYHRRCFILRSWIPTLQIRCMMWIISGSKLKFQPRAGGYCSSACSPTFGSLKQHRNCNITPRICRLASESKCVRAATRGDGSYSQRRDLDRKNRAASGIGNRGFAHLRPVRFGRRNRNERQS